MMCSGHERDREQENQTDKGKQEGSVMRSGEEKLEKKKFHSLTANYQNKIIPVGE